jgi:conjugal transfer/entry exclusion protein
MEATGGGGGDGGVVDQIQKALDDLRSAGEKATGDVRSSIDDAMQRLRDASSEATTRAQDQVSSWRDTLSGATEDMRKELGKLAVRAQTSLDAVEELGAELDSKRKELGGSEG